MPIREIYFKVGFSFFLFLKIVTASDAQDKDIKPVRLMFYNVENLFDVYDDTLTEDNEFLPGGLMRWNTTRYNKKIASLYKTIASAGEWEAPAVVALCEVENRKILENLIFGTFLSKYNYGIIHQDSPDPRGIDVCLIYRKDFAKVIQSEFWIPAQKVKGNFKSRSILYAKLATVNDTLHLIVNHWPSRRGGVLAREEDRLEIADLVRYKADSILMVSSLNARIVIMGDFNSTPDDTEIKRLVENKEGRPVLVNLSEGLSSMGGGTYRYQGTWEMIDQVIVSESLLSCRTGLFTSKNMVSVFKPDFLLSKDPKYPGMVPFSTYRGYRYQGGFSDHLPVLVDLGVR
jgi:endonuclease/exonuclease/phosphatase family metal-dependent hydrolase